MKKRISSITLALLLLAMTACDNPSSNEPEIGNVQVRTAYSTEKVLQDQEYNGAVIR